MHINRQTYEEFFLLYADGELNESERKDVEEFVDQNPDLAGEFEMIGQTIMVPDESIVFANKEMLFRNDDSRKVMVMRWFRYAAAAVLLIALSATGWLFINKHKDDAPTVAIVQDGQRNAQLPAENVSTKPADQPKNTVASVTSPVTKKKAIRNIPVVKEKKVEAVKPSSEKSEPEQEATAIVPEAALLTHDVALAPAETQPIDVRVAPRAVAAAEEQPASDVYYTKSLNEEREKSDMIYFANTSITKNTKLRGVFRKATRYLEKVTSIQ